MSSCPGTDAGNDDDDDDDDDANNVMCCTGGASNRRRVQTRHSASDFFSSLIIGVIKRLQRLPKIFNKRVFYFCQRLLF